jgi:hypothetical protein
MKTIIINVKIFPPAFLEKKLSNSLNPSHCPKMASSRISEQLLMD